MRFSPKKCPASPVSPLLVGLFLLVATAVVLPACAPPNVLRDQHDRVSIGMTLEEAEAILGPARKIPLSRVPETPDHSDPTAPPRSKPVVSGDEFYQWDQDDVNLVVGLCNGRIHDMFYSEPSL